MSVVSECLHLCHPSEFCLNLLAIQRTPIFISVVQALYEDKNEGSMGLCGGMVESANVYVYVYIEPFPFIHFIIYSTLANILDLLATHLLTILVRTG